MRIVASVIAFTTFGGPLPSRSLTWLSGNKKCRSGVHCVIHCRPSTSFRIATFAWDEIGKKNVSHIPGSSRTFTSLNNTCPYTCVFERKRNVCACVFVCSVNFMELRGLSWGALFLQTFAYFVCVCACVCCLCAHLLSTLISFTGFNSWSWW